MGLSTIQWTRYTFNAWLGCRKVAPECVNCYITNTPTFKFRGLTHGPVRVRTAESTWKQPLAWDRREQKERKRYPDQCEKCGLSVCGEVHDWICPAQYENGVFVGDKVPPCGGRIIANARPRPRVFSLSLGDWLDDENVPIEWFADLLKLIHDTPNLDWLMLTKRPQNWLRRMGDAYAALFGKGDPIIYWMEKWRDGAPPANVWIGVSAGADQAAALDIPARVHFLSCEPMLHPVDSNLLPRFDWVIFGGESGSKARECNIGWIREGVDLCRTHGIAPFVKQLGARPFSNGLMGNFALSAASKLHLKDSHGGDMDEWPEDLRVREFPRLPELLAYEQRG